MSAPNKYIFIDKSIVRQERVEDIAKKKGIDIKLFSIFEGGNPVHGILILEKDTQKLFEREIETNKIEGQRNILKLIPQEQIRIYLERTKDTNTEFKALLKEIIRDTVYKTVKKPVVFWESSSVYSRDNLRQVFMKERLHQGIFHIVGYSSLYHATLLSSVNNSDISASSIFTHPLRGEGENDSAPSSFGRKIVDENGTIVAEYHNNILAILFDLTHFGDNNSIALLSLVFKEFIKEYKKKNKEYDIGSANITKEDYFRIGHRLREEIQYLQEDVLNRERDLINIASSLGDKKKQYELIEKVPIENLQKEVSSVMEIDGVSMVYVTQANSSRIKKLIVITDDIEIESFNEENEPRIYEMGRFMIVCPFNSMEDGRLRIYPAGNNHLSGETGVSHKGWHPYVDDNSIPCFGDLASEIGMRHGQLDFHTMISLILRILKEYHPDVNPLHKIFEWKNYSRKP